MPSPLETLMKLLLVEDDASCVAMIQQAVKDLCSSIVITDKLQKAISLLNLQFNAIWLDLSLTDSPNAFETVEAIPYIRKHAPDSTLIVVSGYGTLYRQMALDKGADAYAAKVDLEGFTNAAVAKLLITAAMHAMQRGVDSNVILQRVSSFLTTNDPKP